MLLKLYMFSKWEKHCIHEGLYNSDFCCENLVKPAYQLWGLKLPVIASITQNTEYSLNGT